MLLRSPARVVVFGGGAGGGKSYAMQLMPLRWRDKPQFRCANFRIDRPRLTQEGGLWDESKNIYPYLGGTPNESRLEWAFPSGAKFRYNGLQGDFKLGSKDGGQIPLIQFDEMQEFTKRMVMFMLTRNRATAPGLPRLIRGYCNPDPDGAPWLSEFLQWWWDPDSGYAIPERSGVIRYFVYVRNKFYWADTPAELRNAFPDEDPISATFIRSLVQDNQVLMRNNPEYVSGLKAQDEITREIKLFGNFKIRAIKGSMFNRAWFPMVEWTPINATRLRYWDLAGSDEDFISGTEDPDYTCGLKLARCNVTGQEFVEDVVRCRLHPSEIEQLILNTAIADGHYTPIRIEFEPGSHSKYVENTFTKLLDGFDVQFVRVTKSKAVRAAAVSAQAKVRNVCCKIGPWNEAFFQELEVFPKKGNRIHDDQVDALSGAHNELALIEPPASEADTEAIARMLQAGLHIAQTRTGIYGR